MSYYEKPEIKDGRKLRLAIKYILDSEYREQFNRIKDERLIFNIEREKAKELFYYLQSEEFERDCNYTYKNK